MTFLFVQLIQSIANLLILLIIIDAILSFLMPPYHPTRAALGRILNPLLDPIRRVVPPVGMFDFSPLILIILIQLITRLIISLFL